MGYQLALQCGWHTATAIHASTGAQEQRGEHGGALRVVCWERLPERIALLFVSSQAQDHDWQLAGPAPRRCPNSKHLDRPVNTHMLSSSLQGLLSGGLLPPLAAALPRVLSAISTRGQHAAAAAAAAAASSLATESAAAAAAQALPEQQAFQQHDTARGLLQVRVQGARADRRRRRCRYKRARRSAMPHDSSPQPLP